MVVERRWRRVRLGEQSHQAECLRIVGVTGHHAVAIGDQRSLALCVIGDQVHISRAVEIDVLERSSLVVAAA